MSNQLIQIHGGIGMTDEFDAGFYLKRARVLENLFGNQAFHPRPLRPPPRLLARGQNRGSDPGSRI